MTCPPIGQSCNVVGATCDNVVCHCGDWIDKSQQNLPCSSASSSSGAGSSSGEVCPNIGATCSVEGAVCGGNNGVTCHCKEWVNVSDGKLPCSSPPSSSSSSSSSGSSSGMVCPNIGVSCGPEGATCDNVVCHCGDWIDKSQQNLPCYSGASSSSSSSSSGGTSSGSSSSGGPSGLDVYEIFCPGDPAGSFAENRYMVGSPVPKGDTHRSDCTLACGGSTSCAVCTPVQFKPWPWELPQASYTYTTLGGLANTKLSLDVKVDVSSSYDIRFQCTDKIGSGSTFACYDAGFSAIVVKKNGAVCGKIQVQNGIGGYDCQTDCP
jgi:hypothetical protein